MGESVETLPNREKSILIVGGTGFIGRALTEYFLRYDGYRIGWVSRARPGGSTAVSVVGIEELLASPKSLAEWGHVIYAASASVPASEGFSVTGEVEANLVPLARFLDAMASAPATSLVYLSSAGTVYDNTLPEPSREESPLHALSLYGAGKIAGEAFVRVFATRREAPVSVLRLSNVYGPGQELQGAFGLVPRICHCLASGETLPVHGGGRSRRDYLAVGDLCHAVEKVLVSEGGVYNIASGNSLSVLEVVAVFEKVSGEKVRTEIHETAYSPAGDVRIDIAKARQSLGWSPEIPFEEGARQVWDWWRTRPA